MDQLGLAIPTPADYLARQKELMDKQLRQLDALSRQKLMIFVKEIVSGINAAIGDPPMIFSVSKELLLAWERYSQGVKITATQTLTEQDADLHAIPDLISILEKRGWKMGQRCKHDRISLHMLDKEGASVKSVSSASSIEFGGFQRCA